MMEQIIINDVPECEFSNDDGRTWHPFDWVKAIEVGFESGRISQSRVDAAVGALRAGFYLWNQDDGSPAMIVRAKR